MKLVGFYKELFPDGTAVESIHNHICESVYPEKNMLLTYMQAHSQKGMALAQQIHDIFDPSVTFSDVTYNDGTYGWRGDLPYYIAKYNLKPEQEFIDHVVSNS